MFNLAVYWFLVAVYSVGLTEVGLCIIRKIAYNSWNVEQIYPKIDTGICLYTPNMCTKFQQD